MSLSERVRAGSEAAPWVVNEIVLLEKANASLLNQCKDLMKKLSKANLEIKQQEASLANKEAELTNWIDRATALENQSNTSKATPQCRL